MIDHVDVFADGSCLGNPGPGGYAALLVTEKDGARHERVVKGSAPHTTNNRMELLAIIEALESLRRACDVLVVTDSNYVVQGMTSWIHSWRKKGWKNSKGQLVENLELWQRLADAAARHQVRWQWVRGHAGHPENERVDAIARDEATRARSAL